MRRLKSILLLSIAAIAVMPAYAGQDKPSDKIARITVEELKEKLARGDQVVILDLRGGDYDASTTKIRGAIRIPPAELQSKLIGIPHEAEVVTYCSCSTDGGAVKAAETLLTNGFTKVRALKGGWNAWTAAGGPIEPKEPSASN